MRLEEIMSVPVRCVSRDTTVAEARAEMRQWKVEHLVVSGGKHKIGGVVCAHDLQRASPETRVEEVMSAPAVTLPVSATVQEAARVLRRKNVGCLPLLERGRLAGIVTTSDLLALLGKGALHLQPRTGKWVLAKRGPTHQPEVHGAR